MLRNRNREVAAAMVLTLLVLSQVGYAQTQVLPDALLLKDYRPQPIHKIPVTEVLKAKYPAIDMHAHVYGRTPEEVEQWVKTMDVVGIEKTIVLTGQTGEQFDNTLEMYAKYPGRFELWCGIDSNDVNSPDFGALAAMELERCYRKGARGVGECIDKGSGIVVFSGKSWRESGDKGSGMGYLWLHPDNPRMDPVWQKCAELGMPVSLHMADPIWAYQTMDKTNDGLMNAFNYRVDNKEDIVKFDGMIEILERTLKRHPKTIFVVCHMADLYFDMNRLAGLLDTCPNLYVDTSARFGEMASAPRATIAFLNKYADRVVYGTDQGRDGRMYRTSFRILETLDEHFYLYQYHWNLSGFGLSDDVLKKLYRDTPKRVITDGTSR